MIRIELTNITIFLTGPLRVLNELRDAFKYRHPQAFYISKSMPKGRRWDGYVYPISESGKAAGGLLPKLVGWLDEREEDYIIQDNRMLMDPGIIKERVKSANLRPYQLEAIKAVVNNHVGGVYYPRGIISAATNAGKTLIMAGIYASYPGAHGLILLNDSTLYKQFLTDMPKMFGDKWGYCQGKKIKWGKITVAMVQTLVNHLSEFKEELFNIDVLLIDECDLSTNKTYKKVLGYIPNAFVKVGLSGTVFLRNLAKDRVKNNTIIGHFGQELFKIKNLELMKAGYSTPVVIKIFPGNSKLPRTNDYEQEYKIGISQNLDRLAKVIERAKFYMDRGKFPLLIICRFHEHVELTFDYFQKNFGIKYRLAYVHNESPNRDEAIEGFRRGDIDILVASLLIKRGQNMPLIKAIINTSGGESPETPLQIIGRGTRTHDSKTKFYFDDFWDAGKYLERHSKHRIAYYKNEGFKVILSPELKGSKPKKSR